MPRRARAIRPGMRLNAQPMPSDLKRLLDKVEVCKETGCWNWQAARDPQGYGVFWFNGKMRWAHRASCQWLGGGLEDGQVVNHKCGNRACINPEHLEAVSVAYNPTYRAPAKTETESCSSCDTSLPPF